MNANLQTSQSYREFASYSEDNASTIDRNTTQDFTDWLSQQSLKSGLGAMGNQQAEMLLRQNSELAERYSQKFVNETASKKMAEWKNKHIAPSQVDGAYQHYQDHVPQPALGDSFQRSAQAMKSQAEMQGVQPGVVDKNKAAETRDIIVNLENDLQVGNGGVSYRGDARITDVEAMREKHSRETEKIGDMFLRRIKGVT